VSDGRDKRLAVLVAAVLRGDADAVYALHRHMLRRHVDPQPLIELAERGLARTHAEMDDILRQLGEGGDNHLIAQADGVLRERAGWWRLLDVARRVEAGLGL
jgi:hypothetical protein